MRRVHARYADVSSSGPTHCGKIDGPDAGDEDGPGHERADAADAAKNLYSADPAPRSLGNQCGAELNANAHGDDDEGTVDVDVSRKRLHRRDPADQPTRRRQALFHELVHADGRAKAGSGAAYPSRHVFA